MSDYNDSFEPQTTALQSRSGVQDIKEYMQLKTQLRRYLKERGITAAQLSRLSNVPRQSLSDWLSGTKPRNLELVKRVADALGVSVDQLCFGDSSVSESDSKFVTDIKDEWISGIFEIRVRRVKLSNKGEK